MVNVRQGGEEVELGRHKGGWRMKVGDELTPRQASETKSQWRPGGPSAQTMPRRATTPDSKAWQGVQE